MKRVLLHLENRQLEQLDQFIRETEWGTDRSKLIRAILDQFLEAQGYEV